MALSAMVGSFTPPGSTGNKAVTGLGFTPSVVLFFGNSRTADGKSSSAATNNDMPFCLGVALSPSMRVVQWSDDNFVGGAIGQDPAKVIHLAANGTLKVIADLVSFDPDGFTLNFTTVTANVVLNYIALGGPDLRQYTLRAFTSPSANGNASVTGVGFQPDSVLLLGGETQYFGGGMAQSASARGGFSEGFAGTVGSYQRTTKAFAESDLAVKREADLVSMDSDGFTLNWTTSGGSGIPMYALCLKGASFSIGNFLQKTSTGTQAVTGLGFTPKALMLVSEVAAASTTPSGGCRMMVGGASSTTARGVFAHSSNAFGNAYLSRTKVLGYLGDDNPTPTTYAEADLSSFDTDGFTLNFTTADGTAREVLYFAFGNTPPGSPYSTILNATGVAIQQRMR